MKRPYLRSQASSFVLFLVARVGSTYLTSLLNSHPGILALSEELRDLEEEGSRAQLDWSRNFLTPPIIGGHRARGFNVKLVHLCEPDAFAELLKERHCKVLHLSRRNRVKAVVSRINGRRLYKKTGMWGLFKEGDRLPPLTIDVGEFDELLQHREKVDRELRSYVDELGLPTLTLFYEDMLRDEKDFLQEIYSFLGVEPFQVDGKTLKITSDNLRDAITNFEALRAKYEGTQYKEMFDEVLTP